MIVLVDIPPIIYTRLFISSATSIFLYQRVHQIGHKGPRGNILRTNRMQGQIGDLSRG
jgi:hypothetical protein